MANRILIKRSSSHNGVPLTGDLSLGELAINTYDGRLFAKQDNGGGATIIDLKQNDPIRVLGDASSSYSWDQSTYTSNVTMTLKTVNTNVGTFGENTNNVLKVPKITVNAKGLVTAVELVEFSAAADLGTMSVQNANNVAITGGAIDGTVIGATTAAAGTFTDVTVGGTLYSNDITATGITIDGDATITGDLTVQGTVTSINSTTVTIADKNIELANGATSASQADGAGLTVAGPATPATLTYNGTNNSWNLNKNTNVTGNFSATGTISAGSTTLDSLAVTNNETVGGTLSVTGSTTLAGLTAGASTLGSLSVTNNGTVGGTLGVTGATTLSSTLGVSGATTLSSSLTVAGDVNVNSGNFTVTASSGDTHVGGDLTVAGATTVSGAATVDSLNVTNDSQLGGALDVTGAVTVGAVTAKGVVFGDNSTGALKSKSTFEFDSTTDTLKINNVTISGTASIAGLGSSNVSQGQIVYGGSGGTFVGEAAFTYNATTNTLGVDNVTATADVSAGGTLTVTGNSTLNGTAAVAGNFAVATNKFTVTASNGNTSVAGTFNADGNATLGGTLGVTGDSTLGGKLDLTGSLAINTNKFTVTASNGNTGIAGTLGIAGATTMQNTLDVTGAASFADAVSLTANGTLTLANYNTGSLRVKGDASIDGVLQVSGAIYKSGYEVINTADTIDGGTF